MKYKKIRPKKRKFKGNKILYIFILFLFIGLGYAALTTSLNINGTTNVATNSWNIHFENLHVQSGSVTGNPDASIGTGNMSITYGAELAQPGDYYEFSVDVKNDGSLPGKVSIVNLTGNNTSYLSTSYAYSNGETITVGDILNAGKSKRLTIKAWIPSDIDTSLLPTSDTPITLTFNLQYVQSEEDAPPDATDQIIALASTNSCITKYTGQVTDKVGVTETASNVYFNKCADKRNIKFAGYCWQMIRTTETGGIKMIYNGEPDNNGECGSSRGNHKGIVQPGNGSFQTVNSSYLYGSSFIYDTTNNNFTLTDTETAIWSDSTYEGLIGKFTCKTSSDTCTTLYQINSYYSNTSAYLSYYTIADTNYAQIGTSSYNANYYSPAMVGYMFNKVYNYTESAPESGSLMGNDVSYSNGTYTLLPADGELTLGTTKDNTHHYTCNSASSTCNKVRFYYHDNYYIELDGEQNIDEVINNMLYNDNVNKYNSSAKGIIDGWYRQNLSSKTNMLEDTVYCNARNIINYGGWNPKGGSITSGYEMRFKNYSQTTNLACSNETDQFAVSNNKAELTYPVGLLEEEEKNNINNSSLIETGFSFWEFSPYYFGSTSTYERFVYVGGGYTGVSDTFGMRPVVSLSPGIGISSGTGSESDPFVIQE